MTGDSKSLEPNISVFFSISHFRLSAHRPLESIAVYPILTFHFRSEYTSPYHILASFFYIQAAGPQVVGTSLPLLIPLVVYLRSKYFFMLFSSLVFFYFPPLSLCVATTVQSSCKNLLSFFSVLQLDGDPKGSPAGRFVFPVARRQWKKG